MGKGEKSSPVNRIRINCWCMEKCSFSELSISKWEINIYNLLYRKYTHQYLGKRSSLPPGSFYNHSFGKLIATAQIPWALPLKWLNVTPKWVEQWPLPQIKLEALEQLIQGQLQLGHIEPSTSPWNSPVFVIKKKSGKWRMLIDLREVNKCIEPMGALQLGLPSPALIPQVWSLMVLELKDCFFTIPLQVQDRDKFAFTVPVLNNAQPVKRYQWTVLP